MLTLPSSSSLANVKSLTIAVAAGGLSAEREISLKTATAVTAALNELGHRATLIDLHDESAEALLALRPRPDVVFVALHGGFGEDGRLQAELELAGLPYTGPGPLACKLAMDKERAKKMFTAHGVPTPPGGVAVRADAEGWLEMLADQHGWPLVIKPTAEGSSVGVSLVKNSDEAAAAFESAFRLGSRVLIERCIKGREMTAAVIDGRALPLVEIRTARAFFDYEAKYKSKETQYIVNPPLEPSLKAAVDRAAIGAYRALDCTELVRIDVMVSPTEGPFVLEVNAIPGMTATSLAPKAAAAAGISFPELCMTIVRSGLARKRDDLAAA